MGDVSLVSGTYGSYISSPTTSRLVSHVGIMVRRMGPLPTLADRKSRSSKNKETIVCMVTKDVFD